MPRKILLLSASLFCLSLAQGSAFAAGSSQIISKPLAAPPQQQAQKAGRLYLAQAEGGLAGSAVGTAKNMMGKTAKGTKNSVSPMGKMPKQTGGMGAKTSRSAKTADNLMDMGSKAKNSLKKGTAAMKGKTAKAEEKAAKAERKAAKTAAAKEPNTKRKARSGRMTAAERRAEQGQTAPAKGMRTQRQRDFIQAAGNHNCVCVSGKFCVGPRGGHYCYTSGGNKRYLKRD